MKSVFTWLALLAITAIAMGCTAEPANVKAAETVPPENPVEWVRIPIEHEFEGRTVSLEVGKSVYFFHRNKLSIYDPESNSWEHRDEENPYLVSDAFAVNYDQRGLIYLLTEEGSGFFSFDIKEREYRQLAPIPVAVSRGARIVSDGKGSIYAAQGYNGKPEKKPLYRYDIVHDKWESLSKIKTVNLVGLYSSGLIYWDDLLYAWGDHHISYYDPATGNWGRKIFYPMRYRPAIGEGGMYTFDNEEGFIFVTLGKGSNSLAVLPVPERAFLYLRPRLPIFLSDDDDTLFLTQVEGEKRLNVLSSKEEAIYSIALESLERIVRGKPNDMADIGSEWQVHTVTGTGAGGELIRHHDSYTNMVFAAPYVYNHRKNILRRFNLRSRGHSWVGGCCGPRGAEFKFHKKFITSGAGIAFDADRYFYLFTGHDRQFFEVDLWGGKLPTTEKEKKNPQAAAEDMIVKPLAPLPEQPFSNTAMTYHGGSVWAIFDPQRRNLYRYDIAGDSWVKEADLPPQSVYDAEHGFVLTSSGKYLFLIAKDEMFVYEGSGGWKIKSQINFAFYADGGMVAFDRTSNQFYVAVGNSSTLIGVVDPDNGGSRLLDLEFPDVVSVAGQRMFIHAGTLYISRGHNSAEMWKIPVEKLN